MPAPGTRFALWIVRMPAVNPMGFALQKIT
jgi:hypothetical protein